MSHLANFGLAKADSPAEIRTSKSTVKSVDNPSSAEIARAFSCSPDGSHSLEAAIQSGVDGACDSIGPVEGA